MTAYIVKPQRVEAWQLGWGNWKELSDRVDGKFTQRVRVGRLRPDKQEWGTLEWISEMPGTSAQIANTGDWVVEEQPGMYVAWTDEKFNEVFMQVSDSARSVSTAKTYIP